MSYNSGYTTRQARRELVRAFIKQENVIQKVHNVYYGGKAFTINSIINWCLRMRANKTFSLTDLQYYVTLIQQYIDDKISLSWDGKKFEIYLKEE